MCCTQIMVSQEHGLRRTFKSSLKNKKSSKNEIKNSKWFQMAGSVHCSLMYIFVILQEPKNRRTMYVVHTTFLVNRKNFMCTYDNLFLKFGKSYSFSWNNFFYEKVQKKNGGLIFAKKNGAWNESLILALRVGDLPIQKNLATLLLKLIYSQQNYKEICSGG